MTENHRPNDRNTVLQSQTAPSTKQASRLAPIVALTLLVCAVFVLISLDLSNQNHIFLIILALAIPLGLVSIVNAAKAKSGHYLPDDIAAQLNQKARKWSRFTILYTLGALLLLFIALIPYLMTPRSRPLVGQTRSALKNLAAAQENYFLKHNTYTRDLSNLSDTFYTEPSLTIVVLGADASRWSAAGRHEKMQNYIVYDSDKGFLK
jgi:hypothetical protein